MAWWRSPDEVLDRHAAWRSAGMALVSVVSARELVDARVHIGQYAAARALDIVVPADPSPSALAAARRTYTGQALVVVSGPFQSHWSAAFAHATAHTTEGAVLVTTTTSLVETLLDPAVAVDTVQAALTGMVALHQADGGLLDRVQEARSLSPLLRSPYEGVLYYLLEARRQTRGIFEPNQRVQKSSGSGSWEVDLVSRAHRFVVEIDGDQHARPEQRSRDADKEDDLRQLGYEVLRFHTNTVAEQPVDVWQRIVRGLEKRPSAPEESP